MSRLIVLSLMLTCINSFAFSQTDGSQFVKAQDDGWLVSVDEAYQISKSTNKPILANFTGSDWCGWCKKLRAEVFSQSEFKEWAKDNVVLLELDFPRRKRLPEQQMIQNRSLQQAFQVRGYPTIWIFNLIKPDENPNFQIQALGKTGYVRGGAATFTKEVDKMISRNSTPN